MTKMVRVSDSVYRQIEAAAIGEFTRAGVQQADGSWEFPIGDDTYARVEEVRHPGESFSDCLERVLATMPRDGSTRRHLQ